VVTRRALFAGGAVALLAAGCGEDEEVVAPQTEALARQLDAESALAAATSSLPTGAPRSAAPTVREISARASERAETLAAAASVTFEIGAGERVEAGEAVARAQAAIVAHVVALPSLSGRELRDMAAGLVAGAAADTALLGDALGIPVEDAFPGTPE
jgi:hypothetical protein